MRCVLDSSYIAEEDFLHVYSTVNKPKKVPPQPKQEKGNETQPAGVAEADAATVYDLLNADVNKCKRESVCV